MASASRLPPLRTMRSESKPRFWCRSSTVSAAISARRRPTCRPTERIARSRSPSIVSSAGVLSSLAASAFGKGERRSFLAVNRRAFHVGDRVVFDMVVTLEMFEQAGQRREPAADGGGLGLIDLAHDALPGNHGAVVHLAQLVVGLDMQRPHEVLHVELVGAARAFAFLLGEPDVFFGNVGERSDRREFAGRIN